MGLYEAGFRMRLYERLKNNGGCLGGIHLHPKHVREPLLKCTGTFTKVYGLPCSHVLNARQGEAFRLEDFHSHWHLKRDKASQLLLEPRQRVEPIRARSSLPKSSTEREPSQFEMVEIARQAPTSSKCHAVGHRRNAKACPLRYSDVI